MIDPIHSKTETRSGELGVRTSVELARPGLERALDESALVATTDSYGRILTANEKFCRTLGYERSELLGHTFRLLKSGRNPPGVIAGLWKSLLAEEVWRGELCNKRKDGSLRWFNATITPVRADGGSLCFVAIYTDVTDLKALLSERESLLREVHHRVKNNLQVLNALLNMHVEALGGGDAVPALEDCRGRIASMALVHSQVYESGDFARVEMTALARELGRQVVLGPGGDGARYEVHGEPVRLEIVRAVPYGLILNELLTNAARHGLRGGPGKVTVRVAALDGGKALLSVEDDGPGYPEAHGRAPGSLGLRLIDLLVRQLKGTVSYDNAPGARARVLFPL